MAARQRASRPIYAPRFGYTNRMVDALGRIEAARAVIEVLPPPPDEGLKLGLRAVKIEWLTSAGIDSFALSGLLSNATPCDVIQHGGWFEGAKLKDVLLTFDEARGVHRKPLQGVRSLQAQVDFLFAHLTQTGFRATADVGTHACPYSGFCELPIRSSLCTSQPWMNWKHDPTCWYGIGTAGTLGLIVHDPELVDDPVNDGNDNLSASAFTSGMDKSK